MSLVNIETIRTLSVKTEQYDMPEWGGHVFIRKFSIAQRDELSKIYDKEEKNWMDAMLETILYGVVDEAGNPIFTKQDFELLKNQDGETLSNLHAEILKYNGMTADTTPEVDDLVKP